MLRHEPRTSSKINKRCSSSVSGFFLSMAKNEGKLFGNNWQEQRIMKTNRTTWKSAILHLLCDPGSLCESLTMPGNSMISCPYCLQYVLCCWKVCSVELSCLVDLGKWYFTPWSAYYFSVWSQSVQDFDAASVFFVVVCQHLAWCFAGLSLASQQKMVSSLVLDTMSLFSAMILLVLFVKSW